MNKCSTCGNNLRFWQMQCPVCRNNVWQVPQILFLSTILVGLIGVSVVTISFSSLGDDPKPLANPEADAKPKNDIKVDLPDSERKNARRERKNRLTPEQREQRRRERRRLKGKSN